MECKIEENSGYNKQVVEVVVVVVVVVVEEDV